MRTSIPIRNFVFLACLFLSGPERAAANRARLARAQAGEPLRTLNSSFGDLAKELAEDEQSSLAHEVVQVLKDQVLEEVHAGLSLAGALTYAAASAAAVPAAVPVLAAGLSLAGLAPEEGRRASDDAPESFLHVAAAATDDAATDAGAAATDALVAEGHHSAAARGHEEGHHSKAAAEGHHSRAKRLRKGQGSRTRRAYGRSTRPPPRADYDGMSYTYADIADEEEETSRPADEKPTALWQALGGGTGVRVDGLRRTALDRDLVHRIRVQDQAVALALLCAYLVVICFMGSLKYHDCENDSPATYYADPRYHTIVSEGHAVDDFLDAFNQPPKSAHLKVTGYKKVSTGRGSVQWRGETYIVAFTFALDLSPWVVRSDNEADGAQRAEDSRLPSPPLQDGVYGSDWDQLQAFLAADRNDLASVNVGKSISWTGCDELATNIKHKIRQKGFTGVIGINLADGEEISVYRNTAWANFMHSRTTKVLVMLSIVGTVLYFPYMWLRCTTLKIRSRFKVDIPIDSYWAFINDKLTAEGFNDSIS